MPAPCAVPIESGSASIYSAFGLDPAAVRRLR
jgi:hypothetical protein